MFRKLHSVENTELSEYCLNILQNHGITFIRDFIGEKPEKLMRLLNLNLDQVKHIKKKFRHLYGPKLYIQDCEKKNPVLQIMYGTNIESLDAIMEPFEVFSNFSFWEICGSTGVGKTQLAFTLILNFVINQVAPVLYIDTKLDFSASRIKNMLKAREIDPDLYAGIMSYIKVERVLSAQGVVEMLDEFYDQLQKGNEDVSFIKMIVIDSLPAAWFLLKADSNRLACKWLLSRLSQIIYLLVRQHCIAVVCVNLSLLPSTEENEKNTIVDPTSNNDNDISALIENDMQLDDYSSSLAAVYRPVLGQFWSSKPQVRLSLEYPEKEDVNYKNDSSFRIIKLIKTRFCPSGRSCSARLMPEGFI